ncbi:MAG: tRNA lysidine(34) synthetase TilS [Muribaculaceae bacterium]|nr:tRNA lysidine(34) synthetase TilS [Muribaculaceae bacterium]
MSLTLLEHVAAAVKPGESFLVTLSGGADSVALLAALVALGHECHAVHCNYHLRGDESDRDERHARGIAERLGVPIDVIDCDVAAYRSTHPGESVEMACRALRYDVFERLRVRYSLDSIAVGHHIEDNIETMLLNLLRGSGIKGLAAMRLRRGRYVRPLLRCTKSMILDYLAAASLGYVTDSSNLANDYRRNALRNDIIPAIERYFPDALSGMTCTLDALAAQRDFISESVSMFTAGYVDREGVIDLHRLVGEVRHPRAVLFELLNAPDYRGFNADIVEKILSRPDASGLRFVSGHGYAYLLDHGRLVPDNDVLIDEDWEQEVNISDLQSWAPHIEAVLISRADFKPKRDNTTAYFDADLLAGVSHLILRHPRTGDRIKPYGMKGSRLLSDIFNDMHATHRERREAMVLEADGVILWLVGVRASRVATVTAATTRILRLKVY